MENILQQYPVGGWYLFIYLSIYLSIYLFIYFLINSHYEHMALDIFCIH